MNSENGSGGNGPEDPEESERIRKWREERARIAAQEKAERVRQAKEQRQQELEQEKRERLEKAKESLPDDQDLQIARRKMAERARKRKFRLWVGITVFILLPTAIVAAYTHFVAVPLYDARSVMIIRSAASDDNPSLGGLFSGAMAGGRNLEKAFMANEYLHSREMMEKLESDLGVVSRLSSSEVDPIQRLRDIPILNITKRSQFDRFVQSSVDIQSGLMSSNVRGLSPDQAQKMSESVLSFLADHINSLSGSLFAERVAQAEEDVAAARDGLVEAQRNLTQLQLDSGEADPNNRVEAIYATIQQLQRELEEIRSRIAELEVSAQPQPYELQRLREREKAQQERITTVREELFQSVDGSTPLNVLLLEHELAQLKVTIAEESLTKSLAALNQARKDAELGRSQFQIVVPPKSSDTSTYPNFLRVVFVTLLTASAVFAFVQLLRTKPY